MACTASIRPRRQANPRDWADAKLKKPSQVWKLIDDPVVCVPHYFRTREDGNRV